MSRAGGNKKENKMTIEAYEEPLPMADTQGLELATVHCIDCTSEFVPGVTACQHVVQEAVRLEQIDLAKQLEAMSLAPLSKAGRFIYRLTRGRY